MSVFLTFLLIIVGFPVLHFFICIDRQQKYLIELCQYHPGTYFSPTSFWEQIRKRKGSFQFIRQYAQRKVVIEYFYRWPNLISLLPGIAPEERLEIRFPLLQKFWLRMILEPNHPQGAGAIELNDPEIDSRFIIHSNQPNAAKAFLLRQLPLPNLGLQNALDHLEIHHGVGIAEIFSPAKRNFERVNLDILIEWLVRFFSEYEVQSKLMVELSDSSDRRCPYCREFLQDSSERILECIQCNAQLHENCWKENKQCTTWGCESGVASARERQNS